MNQNDMFRFWAKVDKNGPVVRPDLDSCWVWTGCTRSGYGLFRVGKKMMSAHRISYAMEYGDDSNLLRHRCDNPPCVRPTHLLPGTRLDNSMDMRERNRTRSSLTNEQVIEARRRASAGETIESIINDLPVSLQTLTGAVRGRTFAHLNKSHPPVKSQHHNKLTDKDYTEIREALKKPYHGQGKKLAEKYGVDPAMITLIKQNKIKTR